MTAHELAKKLLELPDLPVIIDVPFNNSVEMHEVFTPMSTIEEWSYIDINCKQQIGKVVLLTL